MQLGGYLLLDEKPRYKHALLVAETSPSPKPSRLQFDEESPLIELSYAEEKKLKEEVQQELEAELQEAKQKLLAKVVTYNP